MIFYFTGTGNSWYAAKKIKNKDEELINITDCVRERKFKFEAEDNTVGIVCPVYYWGVPSIVAHFISKLEINTENKYVYVLFTCGASIGNAGGMIKEMLAARRINLDGLYKIVLPDNYALMYDTPDAEEAMKIINKAEGPLAATKTYINQYLITKTEGNALEKIQTRIFYSFYRKGRSTAKFHVDERCVGCGTCAKRCPVNAIKMIDEKPVWVKDKCVQCLACVRCNAVQYGNKTKKHRRYVHPEYKKITCCH